MDDEDIINSIINTENPTESNSNEKENLVEKITNENSSKLINEKTKETSNEPKENITKEISKEKEINNDSKNGEVQKETLKDPKKEIEKEPIKEIERNNKKEDNSKNLNEEIKNETNKILSEENIKKEIEKEKELRQNEKDEKLERELEKILEEEYIIEEKEEKEIKHKKEEKKKNEFDFPLSKNPLDFVQYVEVDSMNTQISKEIKNSILQNHIKEDNKYDVLEILSLSKISEQFSKLEINAIFAKNNNLILCTNDASISFYSIKEQKLIKTISPKNLKNSDINCLDITEDSGEMICGYEEGTIALINLNSQEVKYTNNKIYKDCSCMELKIYKKEKNIFYFISSGENGHVYYHTLKISLFSTINSTQININNETPIFMIKFINFSLSNQKSYSYLKDLRKYVILGSLESISFYCVDTLKEIFVIKKPDYFAECVPDSQIGLGRIPDTVSNYSEKDENNHILLIISWGNIIYFYQLMVDEEKNINEYKELGYYINMFDILRIGFMNNSVIFCIDKSFYFKIIDSSKINQGKVNITDEKSEIQKNNSLANIGNSRLISPQITSQIKLTNSKNKIEDTYLYSIVDNIDSLISLAILGGKQIYYAKLIDWEVFLNNLQKKQDFIDLFSVGIDLYKGNMMLLSNIPENKKIIGDYLKQIALLFAIINMGEKKIGGVFLEENEDKEKISECIKILIEFCIEIEAVNYLLISIYPLFEAREYTELFLELLQPFILSDKIIDDILSSDIILNLIEIYKKNDKLDILSQMLLHINIKSIETIEKKLEEMFLITPLIYLYMNGQNEDYFLPLEKMFEFYTRAIPISRIITNEEDNSINYSNALIKKKLTLKEVRNCKEYNGHRILWYIRWCLTGKKFPERQNKKDQNKMNSILYDALIPKITYWLLSPKVIKDFLKFDPINYFMIFKNIFTNKDLYTKLLDSYKDSKYSIEVKTMLSTPDVKIDDINTNSIIQYLVNWCKKIDDANIYFYLYDFIIEVLNAEIELDKELKLESICYILKNLTIFIKEINDQEVKKINKNLINIIEKEKQFTDKDLEAILNKSDKEIFNELKLYLYNKIDYFEDYLNLYMNKEFNIIDKNTQLFNWIKNKLEILEKGTSKYDKFVKIIKDYSLPLALLSEKKFFEISKEIFLGEFREIISKLKDDKNVQLKYIELLIKEIIISSENNENNIPDEEKEDIRYILDMHINLLCQLKEDDKIINALKSCSFYPLKDIIKYCEKSNAYQPCLFLYLKEGSFDKAFEMAKSKMDETFSKLIETIKNENNDMDYNNLLKEFHKYLTDIKDICSENKVENEEEIEVENKVENKGENKVENNWFDILEKLYSYQVKAKELVDKYEFSKDKKKNSDDLYQNISTDIKELMEKMCSFVSIKRILELVTEKNKNAGYKEFRNILLKILDSYSNFENILYSAKNLLTNLVLENEQDFQFLNFKGEILNTNKCSKCKNAFNKNSNNKEKILVFSCNHVFHKECIDNTKRGNGEYACPICTELEFNLFDNKGQSSLIKKNNSIFQEKESGKNKLQVNVSFEARKTLQKLGKYDNKDLEKHKLMINNSIIVLREQFRDEYK